MGINIDNLEELDTKPEPPSGVDQVFNHANQAPLKTFEEETDWKPDHYQTLDFKDPVEMLAFFDDAINNKAVILHPWQVETLEQLAKANPNSKHPYKFCLCAANGSGKDNFVIAPFTIWLAITKIRSLSIITSSSGVQLTAQTENYIKSLATKINLFYKEQYGVEIMKVRQRYVKCLLSGSEVRMFATDEEGRAEGYHPLEPNAAFAIIVNEAKSVQPEIFRALRRCTGYNYWINVSTPGNVPAGDFYNAWINWPNKRRVTFYDCPHQSPDEFESDRIELGEHSALFRSKWLALFTTIDGDTIIPATALERLKNRIKLKQVIHICKHWPIRFGLDISAGGDEFVVSIWNGNKQLEQITWRERDTTKSVDRILSIFERYNLAKDYDFIYADDGGLGRAVIDMLRKAGYINVHRILNQSKAKRSNEYRNRGAELWYNFRRMVEEGLLILVDDEKLYSQLATRRHKKIEESTAVVKLQLESKQMARAEGLPSPDRADAAVLAFAGITYKTFYDSITTQRQESEYKRSSQYTRDTIVKKIEDMMHNGELEETLPRKNGSIHGSLARHLTLNKKLNDYGTVRIARRR